MSEFKKFSVTTRKDKMLAKVKEINCSLAGQPDFEKVGSLFSQNTEYRIWRWGDHKCFTLSKTDFSSSFESIEEEMKIICIVPYDTSVDTQQKFISAHYVYHLEEKSSGSRFIWLSTCVYGFDPEVNLTKISQQGELYPEKEANIPFELYSRDYLIKKATEFVKAFDEEYNAFYNDLALYDCRYYTFMPEGFPNPGYYQGLKHIDRLEFIMESTKNWKPEIFHIVDSFVDHSHESYDVVLFISYVAAKDTNTNTEVTCIGPAIFSFENGKIAKELDFVSIFSSIIPSPFDDKTFQAKH